MAIAHDVLSTQLISHTIKLRQWANGKRLRDQSTNTFRLPVPSIIICAYVLMLAMETSNYSLRERYPISRRAREGSTWIPRSLINRSLQCDPMPATRPAEIHRLSSLEILLAFVPGLASGDVSFIHQTIYLVCTMK